MGGSLLSSWDPPLFEAESVLACSLLKLLLACSLWTLLLLLLRERLRKSERKDGMLIRLVSNQAHGTVKDAPSEKAEKGMIEWMALHVQRWQKNRTSESSRRKSE